MLRGLGHFSLLGMVIRGSVVDGMPHGHLKIKLYLLDMLKPLNANFSLQRASIC